MVPAGNYALFFSLSNRLLFRLGKQTVEQLFSLASLATSSSLLHHIRAIGGNAKKFKISIIAKNEFYSHIRPSRIRLIINFKN